MYHKIESESLLDVYPNQPVKKRLKIGTLKIEAHGTRLGERFIKKSFDIALVEQVDELYLTIFPKHNQLISLISRYGFEKTATKTTSNGIENVYIKDMHKKHNNINLDYPLIYRDKKKYILSLYPKWHSRLLPDSILRTESRNAILQDVSHTNSIHKVYLTRMQGTDQLSNGDVLIIYRTNDGVGPAHYRSVATSLCVVEAVRNIYSFKTLDDFLDYTESYSIFSKSELQQMFRKKNYTTIIKFNYNYALPRRITRGEMIQEIGISSNYWGFFELSDTEFNEIIERSATNERIIVD